VPKGLFQVCHHEDAITVLLFDLGLETTLLDRDEVVIQNAGAEHNLQFQKSVRRQVIRVISSGDMPNGEQV
jgi:hypothetical protein